MSALFVALVAASAFFAGLALFEAPRARPALKPGRWQPKRRHSLRARLRRA